MHSAERINPFPTDIIGLRDAINKKRAKQIPDAKRPEKTSKTPPAITPTTNISQKRSSVKGGTKATTPHRSTSGAPLTQGSLGKAGSVFGGAAYIEAAREYRTEENAKDIKKQRLRPSG